MITCGLGVISSRMCLVEHASHGARKHSASDNLIWLGHKYQPSGDFHVPAGRVWWLKPKNSPCPSYRLYMSLMVILESSRTQLSAIVSCVRAESQELQWSPAWTFRSQPSKPLADSIHSFSLQHDSGSYCLCGKGIFVRNRILFVLQKRSWCSGNEFIWTAELPLDKCG